MTEIEFLAALFCLETCRHEFDGPPTVNDVANFNEYDVNADETAMDLVSSGCIAQLSFPGDGNERSLPTETEIALTRRGMYRVLGPR